MNILDQPEQYKKIDPSYILQNIIELPDQIAVVWQEMKKFVLPSHYIQCNKIILSGMGGSGMSGSLVKTLALNSSKMPIDISKDYRLFEYADAKTLVVTISYSGNTEETLNFAQEAVQRGCKVIAISSGGKLERFAGKHRLSHYKINYGAQPRAAIGYSYTALLAIFNKLGIIEISDDDIKQTVTQMKNAMKKIAPEVNTVQNPAKQLAQRIYGKIPITVGAGTMSEVARRYKQNFNENSKSAAYFEAIPEMNHNALVGTEFPKPLGEKIFVILLSSAYDHPRNKLRIDITQQVMEKRRIPYEVIQPTPAANPIAEQMLAVHFGDFISYYLAMLHNIDPEKIEMVDFLKESMSKQD